MTLPRRPAPISAYCGDFASQQLAFAHLLDCADRQGRDVDLDAVEVIGRGQMPTRLAHYFDSATVAEVTRAAGEADTVILMTDSDLLDATSSDRLRYLGVFAGSLVRARPEASC